ncbi:MAG: PAAR domain-containing protein [Acidithiobacillales bacterium]
MASAVEGLSNVMNSFMKRPQMTPADATPSLVNISQALVKGGAAAAAAGAPAAAGTAGSMVAVLNATNVALTATWTAASAVPGGQPAANIAYTEGIKLAAGAAAIAVMASMASLSDMTICPIPVPIPPHGPGFVTQASTTVVVGNLAAARMGDKVFEACGGTAPILKGLPTVIIG